MAQAWTVTGHLAGSFVLEGQVTRNINGPPIVDGLKALRIEPELGPKAEAVLGARFRRGGIAEAGIEAAFAALTGLRFFASDYEADSRPGRDNPVPQGDRISPRRPA